MSSEPDRCYICLGSEGEAPPLARPTDSSSLIRVCPCSLRAHRRCLTDWASDVEFRSMRSDDTINDVINGVGNHEFNIGVPAGTINGNRRWGKYQIFQTKVKCPQCSAPLMIFMKPSTLLNLNSLIGGSLNDLGKTAALATFGAAGAFSLSVSVMGIFVSTGLKMMSSLAPESVLTKLLDFKNGSLDRALKGEEVGARQLLILGAFPVFLFGLRSENLYLDIFSAIYPTFFYKEPLNFGGASPKLFLLFSEPAKRLYWFLYSMTANRLYYRWTRLVKPIFIADRLTLNELIDIEEENTGLKEIENNDYLRKPSVWQRIINRFFGATPEERAIIQRRRMREMKAIFLRDYGTVFQKRSFFKKALTTILWPFLGSAVGSFLLKISKVNQFCNSLTSTPDESTYFGNLLGSLVLVVLKDLYNLYIAYKKVNQLLNIGVLEHRESRHTPSGDISTTYGLTQ